MSLITITTDFHDADGFSGVLKAVITDICANARITDIAHGITHGDVIHAAYVVRNTYLYFPAGTIHLIVIDPGVGGARRALAVEALGQFFVAPDNGVLAWMLRELEDAGEQVRAWSLEDNRFHLEPVSNTFHGRDIFAPVAAYLGNGVDPAELGPELDARLEPAGGLSGGPLVELLPRPGAPAHTGRVAHIDTFGNCITTVAASDLPDGIFTGAVGGKFEVETVRGWRVIGRPAVSYSSVALGEAVVLEGSSGLVEFAVNGESAARVLEIRRGATVRWKQG